MKNILNLKLWVKLLILTSLCGLFYVGYVYITKDNSTVEYKTTKVVRDTLVSSISATGNISSGNTTNIDTKASGIVDQVLVKNGETVAKGQKLLTIKLDSEGVERRSSAWDNYLKSQEAVSEAIKNKQDLEIQVWVDKQAILDAEDNQDEKNLHGDNYTDSEQNQIDLKVQQAKLAFDVTAAKFAHSDEVIAAAKVAMNAAYLDYQDVSGVIVAPSVGVVNNLTLTPGSTLTANSEQSVSSGASYASSQTIGFIRSSNSEYLAKVSLTEADATKVAAGQKVALSLDAHPDKSFTGKVLAVDITGTSNSGVVSYPATIAMDMSELPIYPNMSVSATIITKTITDVLIIPTNAITSSNGVNTVKILVDSEPVTTTVEVGESSDTQTVILSGLEEGQLVITGNATGAKNDNTTSVFSSNRQSSGTRTTMPIGGPGF